MVASTSDTTGRAANGCVGGQVQHPLVTRPLWWNEDWDELCRARPVTSDGRLGRVGQPIDDTEAEGASRMDDVLGLWPRLSHRQREWVRAEGFGDPKSTAEPTGGTTGRVAEPVSGPLLACFVAEATTEALGSCEPEEREELDALVGLPIALDALRLLAGSACWVPGPLARTIVGERFAAAFAGTVGRMLRQEILDAAVMSDHLSYDEAATLMSSDARHALARDDAPFDDVAEGYWESRSARLLTRDAVQDWRVAKHIDCPPDLVRQHLARAGYLTVMRALETRVSDAYVEGLLWQRNQSFRRLVIRRKPDQVVRVMASLSVPKLQRLAEDCSPRDRTYVAAYMGHHAVPVRAAYVRAHPDHSDVAGRALADPSRHVRTALVRYTAAADNLAALAGDTSPAIRREAAARLTSALRGRGTRSPRFPR